jgi:LPS-assembly protein
MRWNFDITNNKTIEDITGVKYESCCVGVMFAYQRERKTFDNNIRIADTIAPSYDYTWFIQFELKGLGGITNSITTLLEESIQGFKQRETQF